MLRKDCANALLNLEADYLKAKSESLNASDLNLIAMASWFGTADFKEDEYGLAAGSVSAFCFSALTAAPLASAFACFGPVFLSVPSLGFTCLQLAIYRKGNVDLKSHFHILSSCEHLEMTLARDLHLFPELGRCASPHPELVPALNSI